MFFLFKERATLETKYSVSKNAGLWISALIALPHCELPLLAHTTAPNHVPVIHHHVSWPFLKKVAVSSSSLDYRVWHVSVKSGIVSSLWSTDLAYEWEGPVFLPQTFLWTPGIPGFSPLCIFCTWCFCVNKELLICNFQSAPIRLPWHYTRKKKLRQQYPADLFTHHCSH